MWGQNAYEFADIEIEEEEVTRLYRRLNNAREHAWRRWQREYINSLMESHRINLGKQQIPEIREIVLVVGEQKNRGEWMKGRVIRHVKGRDGVVRGVVLLHKGNHIQRPLQLVCPLEIKCSQGEMAENVMQAKVGGRTMERRSAAKKAEVKIRQIVTDE